MANYVQFPSYGGVGATSPPGPYVNATGQPMPVSGGQGVPAGYGPASGYYPTQGGQTAAAATGAPPTAEGIQAFMSVRLADGSASYVPVVSQMVGGRLQWVAASGMPTSSPHSPSGGTSPNAPGMSLSGSGSYAGQSYAEMYRMAAERDPANAKYYRKQEKEALKAEKVGTKKTKEWEKAQRAREEEEARLYGKESDRERMRRLSNAGYERERRPSDVGSRPSGILNRAPSGTDLAARFGALAMNGPYPSGSLGVSSRQRRPSVAEPTETAFQRARRASVSAGALSPGDGNPVEPRSRKVSYSNGAATPASTVGAFYPDRERALQSARDREKGDHLETRSPYHHPAGTGLPAGYVMPDGTGRVMAPGGQMMMPSAYGIASPYAGAQQIQPAVGSGAPSSFYREPSRQVPYNKFEPFSILWDLNDLRKFSPPLPALLVTCDVTHDDWNRCMQDIAAAWSGVLPYDLFRGKGKHGKGHRRAGSTTASTPGTTSKQLIRPSVAVSQTLDVWNTAFFYGRKLEVVLYRGLERRSGMTAGRRTERLRLDMIPDQYGRAILGPKRYAKSRRHEPDSDSDESEVSSLTDSSSSDDSSSDEESASDDEISDGEPHYVKQYRKRERAATGSNQLSQAGYTASRSRRSSFAAPGTLASTGGLDMHEMWAVKSREAAKIIRARQKLEKKKRKFERRQRRRQQRGEPLYSLWMIPIR